MGEYFDEIIDRRGTDSRKYGAVSSNVIPMWIADMDFSCPDAVLQAMHKRLNQRILGYSSVNDGYYGEAVCNWMKRRHKWNAKEEQIVTLTGVVTAMHLCIQTVTEPGDGVIILTPSYGPFCQSVIYEKRRPAFCPLINQGGSRYEIDFDIFRRLAEDEKNKLMFLCNPHNPTGRVWTEEELRSIAEICFQNDVFLFCDEIHGDLTEISKNYIPVARLYSEEKRLLTATSVSKTFNLAGIRNANIFIPDRELREKWKEYYFCNSISGLAISAVIAAYTQCDEWVDNLRAYLDDSFEIAESYISYELPDLKMSKREGTYFLWLDGSFYGMTEEELREKSRKAGILLEYASDFYDNAIGCMRMNIACPHIVLREALHRLKRVFI